MSVQDKNDVLGRFKTGAGLTLEMGCGEQGRIEGAVTTDQRDLPGVDLVGDIFAVLKRLPDACLKRVYSSHFLEHVEDLDGLLAELCRVLEPGGILESVTPHFSNPYFYSDPTHRKFFGLYTFSYYAEDPLHSRTVPRYNPDLPLRLEKANLVFKSTRPFYVRHALKKLAGVVFDLCTWTREYYEENLSGFIGCYETRHRLVRTPDP